MFVGPCSFANLADPLNFVAGGSQGSSEPRLIRGVSRMAEQFRLNVNGETLAVAVMPETPLLYVLRNDAKLNGPKFGCGLGQCGACTVLVDGVAARSCITAVSTVGNAKVLTLEGLGTLEHPHPLQRAFIDEQAAQCGYCT